MRTDLDTSYNILCYKDLPENLKHKAIFVNSCGVMVGARGIEPLTSTVSR
jgi:hypothetical protein